VIVAELRSHLERFAQSGDEGLIFVGAKGAMPRWAGFRRINLKSHRACVVDFSVVLA
jgi:hypothetical protein